MGFTRAGASQILQSVVSGCYIGLSTTTPNETGGNFTEPLSSTGYERSKFGEINDSISAQVANDDIIFFNETLSSWGTITHFGFYNQKTGGVPFYVGELREPLAINAAGYVPIFRAENLVIGLDREILEEY